MRINLTQAHASLFTRPAYRGGSPFGRLIALLLVPALAFGQFRAPDSGLCGQQPGIHAEPRPPCPEPVVFGSQALALRSGLTPGALSRTSTAFVFGIALTALTAAGQTTDAAASPKKADGPVSVHELTQHSEALIELFHKKAMEYTVVKMAADHDKSDLLQYIGIPNALSYTLPQIKELQQKRANELKAIMVTILYADGYDALKALAKKHNLDLSVFGIEKVKEKKKPKSSQSPADPAAFPAEREVPALGMDRFFGRAALSLTRRIGLRDETAVILMGIAETFFYGGVIVSQGSNVLHPFLLRHGIHFSFWVLQASLSLVSSAIFWLRHTGSGYYWERYVDVNDDLIGYAPRRHLQPRPLRDKDRWNLSWVGLGFRFIYFSFLLQYPDFWWIAFFFESTAHIGRNWWTDGALAMPAGRGDRDHPAGASLAVFGFGAWRFIAKTLHPSRAYFYLHGIKPDPDQGHKARERSESAA